MKDVKTTYRVNKVDESGNGLAGATLRVTDADGQKIDEWVSDGKAHEIKSLVVGQTYTLTEVKAPEGYVTADPVKFTVRDTETVQTVTMKDDITKFEVSKQDITNDKELPGAHLKVIDKDGHTVDEWISTDKPHYIEKLTAGQTYTLVETLPAAGYTTATSIEFTVKDTGEVQKVTMKDDITRIEISKKDITNGEELREHI